MRLQRRQRRRRQRCVLGKMYFWFASRMLLTLTSVVCAKEGRKKTLKIITELLSVREKRKKRKNSFDSKNEQQFDISASAKRTSFTIMSRMFSIGLVWPLAALHVDRGHLHNQNNERQKKRMKKKFKIERSRWLRDNMNLLNKRVDNIIFICSTLWM